MRYFQLGGGSTQKINNTLRLSLFLVCGSILPQQAPGKNLHVIDQFPDSLKIYRCGRHGTGRLAADYPLKHQSLPVEEALTITKRPGRQMVLHPGLEPQARALDDTVHNRGCFQEEK